MKKQFNIKEYLSENKISTGLHSMNELVQASGLIHKGWIGNDISIDIYRHVDGDIDKILFKIGKDYHYIDNVKNPKLSETDIHKIFSDGLLYLEKQIVNKIGKIV